MKLKRTIAFIIACVLLAFVFYGYFEFNGYPFTKMTARNKINEYLTTHFTNLTYEKSNVNFNFKDNSYFINIDVANTEDGDFSIIYYNGEITNDYKFYVQERNSTSSRLQACLNEDRWDSMISTYLGEDLHFAFLTYDQEYWNDNLPKLDTPVDELMESFPLELTIYLQETADYTKQEYEQIKQKILADFESEQLHIAKFEYIHE